jgi:DNA adenine methylase
LNWQDYDVKHQSMPPADIAARPFLKWAGGKGQLLSQIEAYFPLALKHGGMQVYVEAFVGGGALFFHVARSYPRVRSILSDVNPELILAYRTIQRDTGGLIEQLTDLERRYLSLPEEDRRAFYYQLRRYYNLQRRQVDYDSYQPIWIERTAQLIFLNRTCFNGLFRVNGRGDFNVPFGRYKNPRICDAPNLRAVSNLLQDVTIQWGDFTSIAPYAGPEVFIYFDPPYRPLSKTARFTAYSTVDFDDTEQLRLAGFYRQLHQTGARLMLSNSDPRNIDPDDDFFERAYRGFRIERLQSARNINRDPRGRGPISELLIVNYDPA